MNNIKITHFFILLAILLTACSGGGPEIYNGDALNLFKGTVDWIIDGCLSGACGSEIFTKGNLVVYARPFVDNVSFVVTQNDIPIDKLTGITGNLVNCETWNEFKQWLGDNGFQIVTAGTPVYRTLIAAAAQIGSMELIPIFSINFMTPGELPEWVTGEQGDA